MTQRGVAMRIVDPNFLNFANGSLLGIPNPVIYLIVVVASCWFILNCTRFGWHMFSVGGNPTAARYSGINTKRIRVFVYVFSGLNSDYVNWDRFATQFKMFDFLTEELMPMVYAWYPASDKREDNFIAGLSMGGAGALLYAANHPDKFAAVSCMSCFPKNWAVERQLGSSSSSRVTTWVCGSRTRWTTAAAGRR